MQRLRDGEIDDLVRNTIIWIAVVIWLALGYLLQTPAGGPYTDGLRHAFTIVLAIVIPLVSAIVIAAWVGALRKR
ncbi:MAG: hypothetical protein E6I19_06390 [Chloroflexi bacterium]|nr:MAG: hypothetical protein E6I19_06390 [Chloroflexota bacterium]